MKAVPRNNKQSRQKQRKQDWINKELDSLTEPTTMLIGGWMGGESSDRRKDYIRYDVRTLEEIIRPELESKIDKRTGLPTFQTVSVKYKVEQGLLMILYTDLWETFKETYERNNKDKTYLTWREYRDSQSPIVSLIKDSE
jgi:hypothetical protein